MKINMGYNTFKHSSDNTSEEEETFSDVPQDYQPVFVDYLYVLGLTDMEDYDEVKVNHLIAHLDLIYQQCLDKLSDLSNFKNEQEARSVYEQMAQLKRAYTIFQNPELRAKYLSIYCLFRQGVKANSLSYSLTNARKKGYYKYCQALAECEETIYKKQLSDKNADNNPVLHYARKFADETKNMSLTAPNKQVDSKQQKLEQEEEMKKQRYIHALEARIAKEQKHILINASQCSWGDSNFQRWKRYKELQEQLGNTSLSDSERASLYTRCCDPLISREEKKQIQKELGKWWKVGTHDHTVLRNRALKEFQTIEKEIKQETASGLRDNYNQMVSIHYDSACLAYLKGNKSQAIMSFQEALTILKRRQDYIQQRPAYQHLTAALIRQNRVKKLFKLFRGNPAGIEEKMEIKLERRSALLEDIPSQIEQIERYIGLLGKGQDLPLHQALPPLVEHPHNGNQAYYAKNKSQSYLYCLETMRGSVRKKYADYCSRSQLRSISELENVLQQLEGMIQPLQQRIVECDQVLGTYPVTNMPYVPGKLNTKISELESQIYYVAKQPGTLDGKICPDLALWQKLEGNAKNGSVHDMKEVALAYARVVQWQINQLNDLFDQINPCIEEYFDQLGDIAPTNSQEVDVEQNSAWDTIQPPSQGYYSSDTYTGADITNRKRR